MQNQTDNQNRKIVKAVLIGFAVLVVLAIIITVLAGGRSDSNPQTDQQTEQPTAEPSEKPAQEKQETLVKLADTNIHVPNPENRPMSFQKFSQHGYKAIFSDVEGCGDYSFANIEVFNNDAEVHAAYSQSPGTAESVIDRATRFKNGLLLVYTPPQSACRAISAEDVNTGSEKLKKYNMTISYTLEQLDNAELR